MRLPDEICDGGDNLVFLSSIIHANAEELFPGMTVKGCYQFRLTRNADLVLAHDEMEDLASALRGELLSRRFGAAVRLEVADNCPEHLISFLLEEYHLDQDALYLVHGPVNLMRFMNLGGLVSRPDLLYPSFSPGLPKKFSKKDSIFDSLKQGDQLLLHPYQSFNPVVNLLWQAARDPNVLAIKQTLYRTGADSPIVDHLVTAAHSGKEVTVVIELMARFDEAANIALANRLQEAGAHVVYGLVGFKTHAKMLLVVRREEDQLVRYVHLGTGNYHYATTSTYTDYGYLSSGKPLGEDVHKLFLQLTSLTEAKGMTRMLASPFSLFDALIDKIKRETQNAKDGKDARIIVKVNSLNEPQLIEALYDASKAGVKVDLIVRGICSLRPGVKGLSDNIHVRSIVGRFLEHSRVYYFLNDGEEEFYCSSADWMERNMFRRNESCFEIRQRAMKDKLRSHLELFLADNCQAWVLNADGRYERLSPGKEKRISAQETFLKQLTTAL